MDAVQEVADGIGVGHRGVLILGNLLLGQEDSAGDELLLGLELVVLLLGDLGFGVKQLLAVVVRQGVGLGGEMGLLGQKGTDVFYNGDTHEEPNTGV